MLRRLLLASGLLALAGCAEPTWAPEAEVQMALYRAEGPSTLTVYTVESTERGNGAHSALMVNGSHRALFDPAGTFKHPRAPERNDVHFGMSEDVVAVFIDYHARETYNVRVQEIEVSPEVAARAMALIQDHGAVPKAQCNVAVTRILSQLPGFQDVPRGFYPKKTADWLSNYPGVTEIVISDDDADDNHGVLLKAAEPVQITGVDR